jgi:hypothetical protein
LKLSFRSAPGTQARARIPLRFKPSVDRSCDRPPKSSSKDSRKLFNPHLLSQTRTDVSVQFSRSRRRPAARRRILTGPPFGVKKKVKSKLTFCRFARFAGHTSPETPLPRAASVREQPKNNLRDRKINPEEPRTFKDTSLCRSRQGEMKIMSPARKSPTKTVKRRFGIVIRHRCRTGRELPTAAIQPLSFQKLFEDKGLRLLRQSLESGISHESRVEGNVTVRPTTRQPPSRTRRTAST